MIETGQSLIGCQMPGRLADTVVVVVAQGSQDP